MPLWFFCCNMNIMRTILIVNFSSLWSECGTYSRYILNVSCIVSFVWFFFLHIVRNMTCGGGVMEVMTCWHYTQFLPFLSFWCHQCIVPGALKTNQKCDFWYSLQWKSAVSKLFDIFFEQSSPKSQVKSRYHNFNNFSVLAHCTEVSNTTM